MPYVSPTAPLDHQREALRRLRSRPRRPWFRDVMAWIMETGTGKSKVVLDEWTEMLNAGEIVDLFIFAPAGSYRNWYRDKSDEQPSEFRRNLDPRLLRRMVLIAWEKGAEARDARDAALLAAPERPRVFVANVEAFSQQGRAFAYAKKFLSQGRRVLMVADESTTIRGRKAERTKNIMLLREHASARRILTGLITPKSPMDLFKQFEFLDWRILGFESFVAFRSRYAVTETVCYLPQGQIKAKLTDVYRKLRVYQPPADENGLVPGKVQMEDRLRRRLIAQMDGLSRERLLREILDNGSWIQSTLKYKSFRNLEELQKKIAPWSYRVLKDDCLDLEPKTYEPRDVQLTDEQEHAYQELLSFATTELEGGHHVVSTSVVSTMMRLHQICCGHVVDENDVVRDLKSNRIDGLIEILEDHDGKAIVWCHFRRALDKIVAALAETFGPRSVAQFHGGNKGTRDEEERRFLGDKECQYLCATQGAGGRGNTWNVANLAVFFSNNYDLEQRYQAEDRNHRIGQKRPVTYVDMVARATVEEKIIQVLRKKIDLMTAITGENYREWLI